MFPVCVCGFILERVWNVCGYVLSSFLLHNPSSHQFPNPSSPTTPHSYRHILSWKMFQICHHVMALSRNVFPVVFVLCFAISCQNVFAMCVCGFVSENVSKLVSSRNMFPVSPICSWFCLDTRFPFCGFVSVCFRFRCEVLSRTLLFRWAMRFGCLVSSMRRVCRFGARVRRLTLPT